MKTRTIYKVINFGYNNVLLFILLAFLGISNINAQTWTGTTSIPTGGNMTYTGTLGTNACVMTVTRPTNGCYAYGLDLGTNIASNSNGFTFIGSAFALPHAAARTFKYVSGAGTQTLILTTSGTATPTAQTMTACTGRSAITIRPYLVITINTAGVNWYLQGNYVYFSTKSAATISVNVELRHANASGAFVNTMATGLCTSSWHTYSNLFWGWFTLDIPTAAPSNTGSYCTGETINLSSNPTYNNSTATTPASPTWTYAWTGPASFTSTIADPTRAANTTNEGTYNIVVRDNYSCPSTSSSTTVAVQATPTAGTINNAQTICNGGDPVAIGNATTGTGDGTIAYRWESAVSPFTTWNTIAGATGATYNPPSGLTTTTQYRRFTVSTQSAKACESTNTSPIQITVQTVPTTGAIGNAQTVCYNTAPAAISNTTAGTGSGSITYRWESAVSPFTTWTTEAGSGATFSPPTLTQTTQYRRFTISTLNGVACESTNTSPIQITVQSVPTAGTISSSNIVVCTDGDPAAFNNDVSGTGSGTISYRWESSVSPFSSWSTIAGATGAAYNPPAPLSQTTKYRRYTVSTIGANACESSSPSNEITIFTDDANTAGNIASTTSSRTCVINDANWHYFRNDDGEVIAAVNSNGENLGSTTMTVTIENNNHTYNSVNYDSPEHGDGGLGRDASCYELPELTMRRWYTITPTNTSPATPANVRLFFTAADYANYASEIGTWDTDHTGQNSYDFCYGSTSNNLDLSISKDESYDILSFVSKQATGGPSGTTQYEFTLPSFSTFRFHTTGGIGGPLPVELLSFSGYFTNSTNVLNWSTASEINSDVFIIEKSTDAVNWTVIGEVDAAGNSNERLDYSFIDINPEVGNNYYRLRVVDNDRSFNYSSIIDITVKGIADNKIVNLFPNPTNGNPYITATLTSVQNQTATVEVMDILGRTIRSQQFDLAPGYNNIQMNVDIVNGTYIFRYIDNKGNSHWGKFIKN